MGYFRTLDRWGLGLEVDGLPELRSASTVYDLGVLGNCYMPVFHFLPYCLQMGTSHPSQPPLITKPLFDCALCILIDNLGFQYWGAGITDITCRLFKALNGQGEF